MELSERSQSETVGIVLLTAVVVVVTTTAGLFVLSDSSEQREGDPLANVDVTPTASGIELAHQGGDSFNTSRIRVLVERESGPDQQFTLADAFAPESNSTDQFAAGDRWGQTTGDSYEGELTVTVVATDRGEILGQTTAVVGPAGLELDVEETTISDNGSANYTVTQVFERDDPADVTANATVTVGNESVLDETNGDLVGNNTGTTTVTATYDGETSNTVEVDVIEEGTLEVVGFEHDNPVTPGDVLNITVTVENTGATEASGTVQIQRKRGANASFTPAGLSRAVSLDGGEKTTVEFDYEVERTDAAVGLFRLQATTPDDRVGRGDDIEARLPAPNITIDDLTVTSNAPYVAGEALTAEVTLNNTGEKAGTGEPLNLTVGSTKTQTTIRGLGVGQTDTVSLSVTPPTPARNQTLTASTPDDERNLTVDILEPATFTVSSVALVETKPIVGDDLTFRAVIENTGAVEDTQTVTLDTGSVGAITPLDGDRTVTLAGGEQTTVNLTATSTAGGSGPVSVETDDDSNATTVTVSEPPYFALESVPNKVAVPATDPAEIDFTVTNTGDVTQTQQIELSLGGQVVDSTTVTDLDGGESRDLTLSWDTDLSDIGTEALTVSTQNESEPVQVVVQDPFGDVTILSTTSPVEEGQRLDVTATSGGLLGNELVLSVDGTTVSTISDPDDETTLSWDTGRGDAGERTVEVTLNQVIDTILGPIRFEVGSDSTTVTVEPPEFSVADLSAPSQAVIGDSLTAEANVTNSGFVTSEQSVELRVGSDLTGTAGTTYAVLADQTVEIPDNTTQTVEFTGVTVPATLSSGEQAIGIFTDDGEAIGEVEILAESTELLAGSGGDTEPDGDLFVADGATVDSEIDAGGNVTVGESATAADDVTAGGTVSVRADGTVDGDIEATTVTVDDGGTVTGEISGSEAVTAGTETTLEDDIDTGSDLVIGNDSTVGGDLTAGGAIAIGGGSTASGEIEADGSVTVGTGATVEDSIDADGDVILEAGATVDADVTSGGDVILRENATITGDVEADGSIQLADGATIEGETD